MLAQNYFNFDSATTPGPTPGPICGNLTGDPVNQGIILRPYQTDVIDELTTVAHNGARRLLMVAPTGSGKGIIFAAIIQNAVKNGFKVLLLCHRREILFQAEKNLRNLGIKSGIIMSGEPWDKSLPVQIASINSLHSWAIRRKKESVPSADIVIEDEVHHHNSSVTWQEIIACYPEALILGATATPINRRGKGLGHYFDTMIQSPSISELTRQGYLVPARYFSPSVIDLTGLRVRAGDYMERDLENRMNTPKLVGDICLNWSKYGENRQTLCFASGVKHSIYIRDEFNKLGIVAAHVDGGTPKEERDRIVKDFFDQKIKILSNCAVFTEGTDIPSAACLIFARPTKSLLLYLQVAGRVLRPFEGKTNCVILDHAGVLYEHGPIDQEWEWKLDYGEGDAKKETEKKVKLRKEITCQNCKAVYWGKLACPECGWMLKVQGQEVRTYGEYLQAVNELEHPKIDERQWYLMLRGHALKPPVKKEGWAYYKFKERFGGRRPPWSWRDLLPLEPNSEVSTWIRKQSKKYYWERAHPELAARARAYQDRIYHDRKRLGLFK